MLNSHNTHTHTYFIFRIWGATDLWSYHAVRVRAPDAGQEAIQNSALVTSQAVESHPGPHYELSSGKFLKCRDLAAAGSVARCPPVGESGSSRSPSPRCAPPAHSPRPPRAALRPTRRPLRGAVQSRQVQSRRLLPNRGHDRGGRNTAVRSAAAAPQTARPR